MSFHQVADSKWHNKLRFADMSIFPLDTDTISGTPSFVVHLKNIQLVSWTPLSLNIPTFSRVSKRFFLLSLIVCVVNLAHHWSPQLALQWYNKGPFSAILTLIEKIAISAVPILFVITSIMNRFKLERTTNRFLFTLKALGLWKYEFFFSCKLSLFMFVIGIIALVMRNATLVYSGTIGTVEVIEDTLWAMYYFYLFSWALMFMYTIRAVEACFRKLTEMTIRENANLKSYFQTYNRLTDIATEMNDFYDIPVSLVLLLILLAFIDYTNAVVGETSNMHPVDRLYVYVWITILLALLVFILGTCHSASDEADNSNNALFKYIVHHKNAVSRDNPLLIIHLCARQRLVFRACKSFTINYNLGLSMAAAYVTYMIVLYQVEHSAQSLPTNVTFKNVTN